jgi:hypothetical protein
MKDVSVISSFLLALLVFAPATTVSADPGILVRMDAITNGGAVSAKVRSVLNFYLNFGKQEYDDEILGIVNDRKQRQLRGGSNSHDHDEQEACHLLTCRQCKLVYTYNWCTTVRRECRRRLGRERAFEQIMPSRTTTIPIKTQDPKNDFTNCRQLTTHAGWSAINSFAASEGFTFPSGMSPSETDAAVFICDEDD